MGDHASTRRVRSHPVVGGLFVIAGLALFGFGAFARDAPSFLDKLPVPPEIVVPFILWQLAVWALLFGVFFLRPRGRHTRLERAVPRI